MHKKIYEKIKKELIVEHIVWCDAIWFNDLLQPLCGCGIRDVYVELVIESKIEHLFAKRSHY